MLFLVVVSETGAGVVATKGSGLLGAGRPGWFKGRCGLRGRAFVYSDFGGGKEMFVERGCRELVGWVCCRDRQGSWLQVNACTGFWLVVHQ